MFYTFDKDRRELLVDTANLLLEFKQFDLWLNKISIIDSNSLILSFNAIDPYDRWITLQSINFLEKLFWGVEENRGLISASPSGASYYLEKITVSLKGQIEYDPAAYQKLLKDLRKEYISKKGLS